MIERPAKENIRAALGFSAGGQGRGERERLKQARIGADADKLRKAKPDDLVILAFSGHGYTDAQSRFFLIPSNSGTDSARKALAKFISSEELSEWLKDVDAGEMVMIIDACDSAASVDQPGFKPGPMGDRGLGQLAYDKGMRILAATQADNVALESEKLGQGLLTFALVDDGLKAHNAAPEGKGPITIKGWLGYAEKRVPQLYEEIKAGKRRALGFDARDAARELTPGIRHQSAFLDQTAKRAQTPALFDFFKQKQDAVIRRASFDHR